MSLLGQNRGDRMKENRNYYPITNTVKRIFRAFDEHGESLSTNEIYVIMMNQIQLRGGRPYSKNPSKGTLAQILNKYPYFKKVGCVDERSVKGSRMRISAWRINMEGFRDEGSVDNR